MQNKVLEKMFKDLHDAIAGLHSSSDRRNALDHLRKAYNSTEKADDDSRWNPPGKVVVRNEQGEVVALQG